jgi:hypothetical protein
MPAGAGRAVGRGAAGAGLDPVALGPAEQTDDWPSRLALLNARSRWRAAIEPGARVLLDQARATLKEPQRWRLDRLPSQIEPRRPDLNACSLGGDATLQKG